MNEIFAPENAVPDAPWRLRGDAFAVFAAPFSVRLCVRYTDSPVGAYLEHALGTLVFQNGVLAPHIFQMSVNLAASKIGGRAIWGFPKTLENLAWNEHDSRVEFRRESERFAFRATGPKWNLRAAFFTIQNRDGEWLRVPGTLAGRAQIGFRGRQIGILVRNFEMEIKKPVAAL